MGLDMYLQRRNKSDSASDGCEAAYWRKANQIRKWFVDNTGYPEDADCLMHKVTKEQLEQLVSDCRKVMENHSLAGELMPSSEGFFFGNIEINEIYFSQIRETVRMVTEVIAETDWNNEDVFYYEWW